MVIIFLAIHYCCVQAGVHACKHVHLLGLRAACFTGETVKDKLKLSGCDCDSGDKLKPSVVGDEVS